MNFIARLFLDTVGSEEEAFWLLLALVDGCGSQALYTPAMSHIHVCFYQVLMRPSSVDAAVSCGGLSSQRGKGLLWSFAWQH